MKKLGIIAGNGSLPRALTDACEKAGRPYFIVGLNGFADRNLIQEKKGTCVRLGAVGKICRLFRKNKVQDVVFIGGVRRPSLREIIPDWLALRILFRVGFRLLGDDSLLKIIAKETERLGFKVVGIDEIMPELLVQQGCYTRAKPSRADWQDIRQGFMVAKTLGQVDVGQAVIVQRGLVLSVEGIEGTARLIDRTANLKRTGNGGVLVKVSKPQQDKRLDLPTIGPDTVSAVANAGFKGIAVEKNGTLMVDADKTVELANKKHIFIVGITGDENE